MSVESVAATAPAGPNELRDGQTPTAAVQTMDDVMARLVALGEDASYTARMLRGSYQAQRQVVGWIRDLPDQASINIKQSDAMLLRWLHSCYLHVSSLPSFSSGVLPLAPLIAATGLLRPFIGTTDGILDMGMPSNTEATADSLSELLRLAGAAVVAYHDYLTNSPPHGSVPRDEAALLFSTMAIRSISKPNPPGVIKVMEAMLEEAREAIQTGLFPPPGGESSSSGEPEENPAAVELQVQLEQEREQQREGGAESVADGSRSAEHDAAAAAVATLTSFGISEVRWLMHWLRSQLSTHFAALRHLLGDEAGDASSLVAAQQDKLCMLKLVPGSLCSYVMYGRSCLQFQQYKAAHVFSGKGVIVARALRDDAHMAQLLLMRATAAALGGGGQTFSAEEVAETHGQAMAAKQAVLTWLPEQYLVLDPLDLDPELTLLVDQVITPLRDQHDRNQDGAFSDLLPALQTLYQPPEPTSVPPGAVMLEEDGAEDVIPEGDETDDTAVADEASGEGRAAAAAGQATAAAAAAGTGAAAAAAATAGAGAAAGRPAGAGPRPGGRQARARSGRKK